MVIISIRGANKKTIGYINRFLTKITSNTFCGEVSAKVREELWHYVLAKDNRGNYMMIYSSNKPCGFTILKHNFNNLKIEDVGISYLIYRTKKTRKVVK